jgi:hypothetical protein
MMTQAQAGLEQNRIFNEAYKMVTQGEDPSSVFSGAVAMGAITPAQAQAWMSDPAFLGPMRDAALQNLQKRQLARTIDQKKATKLQNDINAAPDVHALRQAEIKYYGTRQTQLAPLDQSIVDRNMAATDEAQARTTEINDKVNNGGASPTQAIAAQHAYVASLQTEMGHLKSIEARATANGDDVSQTHINGDQGPLLIDREVQVQQELDAARQQYGQMINGMRSGAVNSSVNSGAGGFKVKAPPRPSGVPPTAVPGTMTGHKGVVWQLPDGSQTWDSSGKPIH